MRRTLAMRRLRRDICAVPRRSLADVAEDAVVRVTGIARPLGPVLEAPLSGRVCVCYAIVVYEWRRDGSVSQLTTEEERVEFALDDELDDHAVIDPANATVSVAFDHTTEWFPRGISSPAAMALLERRGFTGRTWKEPWSETRSLECCEAIVEVDERIAVVGTGIHEPDPRAPPAAGYRDGARAQRLRIAGSSRQRLVISDDPRTF